MFGFVSVYIINLQTSYCIMKNYLFQCFTLLQQFVQSPRMVSHATMRLALMLFVLTQTCPRVYAQVITDKADLQQMMDNLGVTIGVQPDFQNDPNRPAFTRPRTPHQRPLKVWTDVEGYSPASPMNQIIVRSPWGLWVNYHPEQAYTQDYPVRSLPATLAEWQSIRPEMKRLCQEEVWGVVPACADSLHVDWVLRHVATVDSTFRQFDEYLLTGVIDIARYPELPHQPLIRTRLYVPTLGSRVPAVVHFVGMGSPHPVFLSECIRRGWAYIQMDHTALQPDNGAWLRDYLIGLCNRGSARTPSDWGALAAWGWGVSRLIDYFSTSTLIDSHHVTVAGHSRCGKAALVTAAYDERVFAAFVSCSGAGGAAPIRRHFGEDIEQVATYAEYHWLAGNVTKYCGPVEEKSYFPRRSSLLPIDSHVLLALCAPRPIFITGGTEDLWADPYGMFMTCQRATPVYQAYGKEGLATPDATPTIDKAYTEGLLGYRLHQGGHVDYVDFPIVAQWLERQMKP